MAKLILSLDGGGIRGAATAQFLNHIENRLIKDHNTCLRDCVDFYAGTSTGSIIALALATTDMPMEKISSLYGFNTAKKIFAENRGIFDIDGINAPKYEADGKTSTLKSNLGKAKLGNVPNDKHVLAIAYDIEVRKPAVIKSTDTEHRKLFAYQVADASSAAPTYFPTTEMKLAVSESESWLVDGGVTANNPTMCAIAEARKVWSNISIDQMRVISIGTGYQTRKINGPKSQKWGAIQWFTEGHILDVLTDERVVSYQAVTIMKRGNYIRVNANMVSQPGLPNPPDDAMDDISKANIAKLRAMGDWWHEVYGDAVVAMMLNQYDGPSLERIETGDGKARTFA